MTASLIFATTPLFRVVTFAFLIFGEIFFVIVIEKRPSTLAVVRSCAGNLHSRRQWANWGRVGTANIECRNIFTLSKNHRVTPLKGKRTEAPLIGEAGNNAPVGLELHPYERVAKLWRRLGWNTGNLIGRRQGTNYERLYRGVQVVVLDHWRVKGGTPPFICKTLAERSINKYNSLKMNST